MTRQWTGEGKAKVESDGIAAMWTPFGYVAVSDTQFPKNPTTGEGDLKSAAPTLKEQFEMLLDHLYSPKHEMGYGDDDRDGQCKVIEQFEAALEAPPAIPTKCWVVFERNNRGDDVVAVCLSAERANSIKRANEQGRYIQISEVEAPPAAERTAFWEKIDEIRGAVERESYWCEDCQLEYPKKGFEPSMHSEHEVVPITVIAGWRQAELTELADAASASEGTKSE